MARIHLACDKKDCMKKSECRWIEDKITDDEIHTLESKPGKFNINDDTFLRKLRYLLKEKNILCPNCHEVDDLHPFTDIDFTNKKPG